MMAPYGHEHELRVPFVIDDQCWGSVCFVRDGSRADFDRAEVGFAAGLARHVAQGLCGAVALAAAEDPTKAPAGLGMLVLDDEGRMVQTSPEAEQWIAELEPTWDPSVREVPVAVLSAFTRARAAHESGGGAAPPRIRVRTAAQRWLVVHASRLVGSATRWAVVIEPARPSEVLTLVAFAHGLTPREQEVFGLLMRGISDAQMAEQLVVSPHTQREHVKRVLQKFGVRNRAELVVSVYAEQQSRAA
jgi:DNA-binding CsgD family transcriptional regulator